MYDRQVIPESLVLDYDRMSPRLTFVCYVTVDDRKSLDVILGLLLLLVSAKFSLKSDVWGQDGGETWCVVSGFLLRVKMYYFRLRAYIFLHSELMALVHT